MDNMDQTPTDKGGSTTPLQNAARPITCEERADIIVKPETPDAGYAPQAHEADRSIRRDGGLGEPQEVSRKRRKPVLLHEVNQAVRKIRERGGDPTIDAVHQEVGGSRSTLVRMIPQALLDEAKEKEALLGMPQAFKAAFFSAMADTAASVKGIYSGTLDDIGRRADEAGTALEQAEQANEDLREENQELRTSLEAALKERDEQVRGKDTEIHGLKTLIKSHEDAKRELETRLDQLRTDHTQTQILFRQQQDAVIDAKERLQQASEENHRLQGEKHSAEKELAAVQAQQALYVEENKALKLELAQLREQQDAERRALISSRSTGSPSAKGSRQSRPLGGQDETPSA